MPRAHTVAEGECLTSIAFSYGFAPETVWNDEGNAALREKRASGYVLEAGDVLRIPDRTPKSVPAATGKRHVFRRKAVPATFTIRIAVDDVPRANVPWVLEVAGGAKQSGTTDADGKLTAWIPPDAAEARLLVGDDQEVRLNLGHLDPVTTESGVLARLRSLGYLRDDAAFPAALEMFQKIHALDLTGEADEATCAKLVELYGS